ncbi:glycosyltransferase family 2 protein [Candidatus Poriferisocius sp.]|uniref:glycosyltransferase family 2 protein n=1 Tax=Candidatus Poriferisocius sp. TaxID=3101276 RepID=UPI003B01FB29
MCMAKLIAVIPAHNEEATVGEVITEVQRVCSGRAEVVVIDDGSIDHTFETATAAGATVLRFPINLGYGAALRLGFRYAADRQWDHALVLDADGQHIATEIPTLLAARDSGADLVLGSRFHPDCPAPYRVSTTRRSAMRLAGRVLRHRYDVSLTDPTSGFWALSRPCIDLFSRELPTGFLDNLVGLSLAARAGMAIAEVPVTMAPRQGGRPSARGAALAYHYLRTLLAVSIGGRS